MFPVCWSVVYGLLVILCGLAFVDLRSAICGLLVYVYDLLIYVYELHISRLRDTFYWFKSTDHSVTVSMIRVIWLTDYCESVYGLGLRVTCCDLHC